MCVTTVILKFILKNNKKSKRLLSSCHEVIGIQIVKQVMPHLQSIYPNVKRRGGGRNVIKNEHLFLADKVKIS